MADVVEQADRMECVVQRGSRLKWTNSMNTDLLECKRRAKELKASEEPPRNLSGRKKGYMQIMKELWDEAGYAGLQLTAQNLRDQADRLEKTLGNVRETITKSVRRLRRGEQPIGREDDFIESINSSSDENPRLEMDLHITPVSQIDCNTNLRHQLNTEERELLQLAAPILATVKQAPGDFTNRSYDTRTKERPTKVDISNINTVVNELMYSKTPVNACKNPFGYLWLANCILYSVVVAFYISKGWKKQESGNGTSRRAGFGKRKEAFENRASEIRGKLSKAKAELERIKLNKKITKKGRKNRAQLLKECKTLSVASLVAYMEKEKVKLRKLKRNYHIKKIQQEARKINRQFQLDSGSVYANFKKIIESQGEAEKPRYVSEQQDTADGKGNSGKVFASVTEATTFWKQLWETEGTGSVESEWLDEIRNAMGDKVPEPHEGAFELCMKRAVNIILKKRNWSAPGPDRIANFWWKRATTLHDGIAKAFQAIAQEDQDIPLWFTEGQTSLIPKPGEFTSENQRPITCLNTIYKWFTSCLLKPIDHHLDEYNLMEREQRGAREKCSGTMDNLLIDRMVCQDCHRGRRNLSMAWIDVRKAYDSVNHHWLREMFSLHRFPKWIGNLIARLSAKWNTRIAVQTKQGREVSERLVFRKGLPQGDALCPKLFTLSMNPIAWKLRAAEGYKLSKPISHKITDLLYVDDLKVYASSEGKLERVLRDVRAAMKDIGLYWNEKKCAVAHVKRGCLQESLGMRVGEQELVKSLREDSQYKFLGILENIRQQDTMTLQSAEKVYLQRLSVIWTSPLSDHHKVDATNQFALPVLTYFMWTQVWAIAELQRIDRESRKVIADNGGKHPLGSTDLLYLPRRSGGRGLISIESEYKLTKIKAAVKLYSNKDPTMYVVRQFEERAERTGRRSLAKDAGKYAEELGVKLELHHHLPLGVTETGETIEGHKIGVWAKKALQHKRQENIRELKWQGKLISERWEDESLDSECFGWMYNWRSAPTHTIASIGELYEQLLPTKLYHTRKTRTTENSDETCKLCGKAQESVAHVLSGCNELAHTKYLDRHNAALKILFFELLKDQQLIETIPPWYSPTQPKPLYENDRAVAYWDVPLYAYHTEVRANRVDARIIDKQSKRITMLEMSCPWIENRQQKEEEKMQKYAPLRWELKKQYPGYHIDQVNIIMDVLGGYSKGLRSVTKKLLGERHRNVLSRMQKSVLCSSLNIARSFKVVS